MKTIPVQEIKRRGISVLDKDLKQGPVHVIKNNRPQYVVLSEERYRELLQSEDDAYIVRVKASLEDVAAGRVHRFSSVEEMMQVIERDEDDA